MLEFFVFLACFIAVDFLKIESPLAPWVGEIVRSFVSVAIAMIVLERVFKRKIK